MYCLFDRVRVISGRYEGSKGTIQQIYPRGMDTITKEPVYMIKYDNCTFAKGMFKDSELELIEEEK